MTKTILTYILAKQFFIITILVTGLVLTTALAFTPVAHMSDGDVYILVDTFEDENFFVLGDNGNCSLREAIYAVNVGQRVDVCDARSTTATNFIIKFKDEGTYILDLDKVNESNADDRIKGGDLDILKDVIIEGDGANSTTIMGSMNDRIFEIDAGVTVEIKNLTIAGGQTSDGIALTERHGGGVFNYGTLTVDTSVISNNSTGSGGTTLNNGGSGGGVFNAGKLTVSDSTISYNSTGDSGSLSAPTAGTGGGIYSTGALTITTSTISGNSTGDAVTGDGNGGYGGGVFINFGSLVMINSTVSSNTTGERGGGGNSQNGIGGGIYIAEANVTTNVKNSILANNYRNVDPIIPDDCFASISNKLYSNGYNLIEADGYCEVDEHIRVTVHEDPKLLPLANNGGETPTHALPPGSPAINNGSCEINTKDQRGKPRPVKTPPFEGDPANGCDIGAYEAQPELVLTKNAEPTNPDRGDVVTYTITVVNNGGLSVTNVFITDTMDSNLNFIGPVTYEPDNLPGVGAPPSIVSGGLNILPGMRITFTYPVSVSNSVLSGTHIINTAMATCDEYAGLMEPLPSDTASFIIGPWNPFSDTRLVVTPASSEIYVGDTLAMDLDIENVAGLYAAQATCTVDPTILEPQAGVFGDFFDPTSRLTPANEVDAAAGSWFGAISQQRPAEPLAGDGLLATLTYEALSPGVTALTCEALFSDRDGFEISVSVFGAEVTVLAFGSISGAATYQGRLEHAGIEVTATGPVTRTTVTDNAGGFMLDQLKLGSYEVKADTDLYLPSCATATVSSGETVTLDETTLAGGDLNDNGVIDIGDVTLLTGNFGLSTPPGDPQADINVDGVVDARDLAILAGNYELSGCQDW